MSEQTQLPIPWERLLGWLSRGASCVDWLKRIHFIVSYKNLLGDLAHTAEGYAERSKAINELFKAVPAMKHAMLWPIDDQIGYDADILEKAMKAVDARYLIQLGDTPGICSGRPFESGKLFSDRFAYQLEDVNVLAASTAKLQKAAEWLNKVFPSYR